MNVGMNRWRIAGTNFHHPNETWKLLIKVHHEGRYTNAHEYLTYRTGWIEYYILEFLFSIHRGDGSCVSGDLKYPSGKQKSNKHCLDLIKQFKDSDIPLFPEDINLQFIYLEKLYELTHGKMLTRKEYEQFKQMYHAIQRHDYTTVVEHLSGLYGKTPYKPNKILNHKEQ